MIRKPTHQDTTMPKPSKPYRQRKPPAPARPKRASRKALKAAAAAIEKYETKRAARIGEPISPQYRAKLEKMGQLSLIERLDGLLTGKPKHKPDQGAR